MKPFVWASLWWLVSACANAEQVPVDLSGAWLGQVTGALVRSLALELTAEGGTWAFSSTTGEGTVQIRQAFQRSVELKLSELQPCSGEFVLDGFMIGADRMEGSFSGYDCQGPIDGDMTLERASPEVNGLLAGR